MRKRIGFNESANWLPYAFIAPAVVLIIIFLVYPVTNVFYYSLQNYNINTPKSNSFIGITNFINIFTKDKLFYLSLFISLKWVVVEVIAQLIIGLVAALVLSKSFKGRGLFRTFIFSPWAISGVLTSMMWSLMFNEHVGVINDLLIKVGILEKGRAWIASADAAFASAAVAELWRGIPFFSIMLLAALQTIPMEVYEACKVDGGSAFDEFKYIILPYLKETIILSTLLRAVWEFNNVDLIYTLTGGGPINATTTLIMYLTNTAIRDSNFGYGSALSVVAFMILLIFAIAYLKISKFGRSEM